MSVTLEIPGVVVHPLRESACAELEDASAALTTPIRRRSPGPSSPQPFIEHRGYFNAVCALLDELGWLPSKQPTNIEINLREHHAVLLTALRSARETAERAYADLDNFEDPIERRVVTERAQTLRDFTLATEVKARAMQHEPGPLRIVTLEDLGAVIDARLKEFKVTHEEMAEVSTLDPVDPEAMRQLTQGESNLPLKHALRLLNHLGLDVELHYRQASPAETRRRNAPPFIVPAEMERPLRTGLITVLCNAAQGISVNAQFPEREQHPEWYSSHRKELEAACALLDLIGWGHTEQTTETQLDLHEHQWALQEALDPLLRDADTDLKDAEPSQRVDATQRVSLLRGFADAVKASVAALDRK